ncbi:MAG TPA: HAD family hydrolase [Burkholderiales bacterium]|nr:HAD family hydrolase [Burkholderiales bacterium]
MVVIFDLDDTLYPELTYVTSGFGAVAAWARERFGWDETASVSIMSEVLEREGRGRIFDQLLERHGVRTRGLVAECVKVYRHHKPDIRLFPAAAALLRTLVSPLYVVTDGHKIAQQKKVEALGIAGRCKRVFITHRYGLKNAKPSTYCFDRIRQLERCAWSDMVYVGDNPAKDFVKLNPLGVLTVRVLSGNHRAVAASAGFDAVRTIPCLEELPRLLEKHSHATA